MWNVKLLLVSVCVVLVSADFEMPNLDNVGSILQTLKNTGMLDQFQEKFTKMFLKEKLQNQEEDKIEEYQNNEDDSQMDFYDFIR
jgi:hypothetical protein